MKTKVLGLALIGANLLHAQSLPVKDSISMSGCLEEIDLLDLVDSTQVSDKNIFIPIEQLVQKTEGANLISRGNFAQDPMLRSYKGEQINVTLNGMRMYGACTDRMDPITSYAETSNLESISVSHSGQASLSGNALGGSLSMNLKEAGFNGNPITQSLFGTSISSNTHGYKLFGQLDHRNKKWGIYLQAATRKHQNYKAGGGEEINFSQYQKVNATANVAYKISKREVLKLNFLYDRAQDIGYPALPMDVGIAEASVMGAHYQNFINSKVVKNWEAMVYYNNIYHEMDDTQRPDVPMHMDMPGWSNTFGAWIKMHNQETKKHTTSFMVEYYQNFRRAEMTMYPENEASMFMLTWPDIMRITSGLGVTDTWEIHDKLNLNTSARVDINNSYITTDFGKQHLEVFGYNVDGNFIEPIFSWKENLIYSFGAQSKAFINLAYAERIPDVSEQFGFYLYNANDGYDYIGNPEINKEKAWQSELGFAQDFKQFNWKIKGYFHHVNNYILGRTDSSLDAMTIGANGVRVYVNLPYAKLMGGEFSAQYLFNENLSLKATAQYTHGTEKYGEPLPLIAPLQGIIKLNWQKKGWYSNASVNWAGKQNRVNKNFGDLPTRGYALLNATFGKNWSLKKVEFKTEIVGQNLFDHYYRNHLSWSQVPQMGRNIMLNLVVKL